MGLTLRDLMERVNGLANLGLEGIGAAYGMRSGIQEIVGQLRAGEKVLEPLQALPTDQTEAITGHAQTVESKLGNMAIGAGIVLEGTHSAAGREVLAQAGNISVELATGQGIVDLAVAARRKTAEVGQLAEQLHAALGEAIGLYVQLDEQVAAVTQPAGECVVAAKQYVDGVRQPLGDLLGREY